MSIATDLGLTAGECMDWVNHFWNVSVGAGNGAKNILGIAQQRGWQISAIPSVGSIAVYQPSNQYQMANGTPFSVPSAGHAAIVTAVSGDGSAYTMSEMNGIAGYGNVDQQTMKVSGPVAFVTPPASLKQGNNFESTFGSNSQTLENVPGTFPSSGAGTSNPGTCKSLADAVSGGIPLVSGTSGFFGWIAQGCVYKRILIYMASGALIVFGLKYLGVTEPARLVTDPARAYGKVVGTGVRAAAAS